MFKTNRVNGFAGSQTKFNVLPRSEGRRIARQIDKIPWRISEFIKFPQTNGRCLLSRYKVDSPFPISLLFFSFFYPRDSHYPHNPSYVITLMSSITSHTAHSERPERSRNAKAQARHRAKRKAYIDQVSPLPPSLPPSHSSIPQLEQTVTKLQIAVGYTTEQVSALPPPLLKIRELEQDNARLQKENEELRRLLQPDSRTDASRRTAVATYQDPRTCDRDYNLKRRKAQDGVYIVNVPPPILSSFITKPLVLYRAQETLLPKAVKPQFVPLL